MNLYEIKNEYLRAFDELSKLEELDPEVIRDSLAGIEHSFEEKALNVCAHIKNLEAEVIAMETYEKRMAERRAITEGKIKRLKEYVRINLEACAKNKIVGTEFNIYIRNNPPRVVIDDISRITDEWFVTDTIKNIDKDAIKYAIQNGKTIEGVHLEQGTTLIIK